MDPSGSCISSIMMSGKRRGALRGALFMGLALLLSLRGSGSSVSSEIYLGGGGVHDGDLHTSLTGSMLGRAARRALRGGGFHERRSGTVVAYERAGGGWMHQSTRGISGGLQDATAAPHGRRSSSAFNCLYATRSVHARPPTVVFFPLNPILTVRNRCPGSCTTLTASHGSITDGSGDACPA